MEMLILPKLNKGIKQAMTKLEKGCKTIVAVGLVVGVVALGNQSAEASVQLQNPTVSNHSQSAMLLMPAIGRGEMIARHYSHSSHASHASHYSSRH
jgi:hypothetical protein